MVIIFLLVLLINFFQTEQNHESKALNVQFNKEHDRVCQEISYFNESRNLAGANCQGSR